MSWKNARGKILELFMEKIGSEIYE